MSYSFLRNFTHSFKLPINKSAWCRNASDFKLWAELWSNISSHQLRKYEIMGYFECSTNSLAVNDFFLVFSFPGLKNTQDQIIHLQHIIQLLPLINRDTLYVLLQFLGLVAENAEDRTDEAGNFLFLTSEILNFFSKAQKSPSNMKILAKSSITTCWAAK